MLAPAVEMSLGHEDNDPATTETNASSTFPPCTAKKCNVDAAEKKAAEAKSRPSCEMTEKCVNACAGYGRVCPCAARISANAACDAMQELQVDSKIFYGKPDFTYINADDIQIGQKLGEGGFSNVNECIIAEPDNPDSNKELAVKYLKRKAMVDLHQFKHGAADLAVEAYFLQSLDHPNIIKLHGITAGSVETNVATGKECGFFILLDRLHDTLEKRIEGWRFQQKLDPSVSFLARRSAEFKESKRVELVQRCTIALDIARAMEYLHSLNVIFRDLKPDNIGFDQEGTLKLFDFGLAKELKHPKADGYYALSGHTGSRRYMAPEVAQDLHYDLSVDVYSFGIMLWELCSSEKPFYGYSSNKHMQLVVLGGERPKLDAAHTQYWPTSLQNLMKKCWSSKPAQRPSFTEIIRVLERKVCGDSLSPDGSLELGDDSPDQSAPTNPDENTSPTTQRTFARLFPVIRAGRAKSVEAVPPPSGAILKALKPATKERARTWGFNGTRR